MSTTPFSNMNAELPRFPLRHQASAGAEPDYLAAFGDPEPRFLIQAGEQRLRSQHRRDLVNRFC